MGKMDVRVDAFIAKAGEFAKPILERIRRDVHAGCPGVEETIKWGMAAFVYKGNLCLMGAFKKHCAFLFWHPLMREAMAEVFGEAMGGAMGGAGRLMSVKDLPARGAMVKLVKRAAEIQESGVKVVRKRKKREVLAMPEDFGRVLDRSKKLRAAFEALSPSCQREYIEYVAEAKREETRLKRIEVSVEKIREGKSHNWKYERK